MRGRGKEEKKMKKWEWGEVEKKDKKKNWKEEGEKGKMLCGE